VYAVSPEVSLLATPGHTRGHLLVAIESAGSSAVITGDMMHHPVQVDRPDVALSLDVDTDLGAATRQAFVNRYTGSGTLVFGTHFAHPSAGFLVRTPQGVRFVS
jgi:glyoxylase-like metal-dependent hydrolase (beta-lactamase superfamily II)